MILTETPRRKLVTKLVNWGHWFALVNIVIAIVIASIYVFTSPLPGTVLGTLYLFANWFSHIGFLTFIGFVIFILPLCYLIPSDRYVKAIGSIVGAFGLALMAFDALLYNKHGLHLSLGSAELIRSEAQNVVADFGWQQWGFLLLLFFVWLSFQLIVANAIWKRLERLQKYKLGLPISSFFVICFVSSHAIHVWADANLYQPIVQQDDMFPLSYPATAKTLMSKYGLLDIQNYQQRKALQFDYSLSSIRYPISPVYCGLQAQRSAVLLVQIDGIPNPDISQLGLNRYSQHYSLNSDFQSLVNTTLFGMPELYLSSLKNNAPLLLELPSKLNLPVMLYSDQVIDHSAVKNYTVTWEEFKQNLKRTAPSLSIAFVDGQQMQSLLTPELTQQTDVFITGLAEQDEFHHSALYSNVTLQDQLSSAEDLAPTLLNHLGCAAPEGNYSTGQNLAAPKRSWLVGTQGNKVVVMHNGHRIEVMSNGSYKIFERDSGQQSVVPLNTGLLSQAMKHLSRFYK